MSTDKRNVFEEKIKIKYHLNSPANNHISVSVNYLSQDKLIEIPFFHWMKGA